MAPKDAYPDQPRSQREVLTQTEAMEGRLKKLGFEVKDELYHDEVTVGGKNKFEFTIPKGSSFSAEFTQAMFGKGFPELSPKRAEFVLNASLMLSRRQGINMYKMPAGANWKFEFKKSYPGVFTLTVPGKPSISGTLELPKLEEKKQIIEETKKALGSDLMTAEGLTETGERRGIMDIATQGVLTDALQRMVKDISLDARKEMLGAGDVWAIESVKGINKYLRLILENEKNLSGDALEKEFAKYQVDENGTKYRGAALQNRAWLMWMRYDYLQIEESPYGDAGADLELDKSELDNRIVQRNLFELTRAVEEILRLKLGEDSDEIKLMDFNVNPNSFYFDSVSGLWKAKMDVNFFLTDGRYLKFPKELELGADPKNLAITSEEIADAVYKSPEMAEVAQRAKDELDYDWAQIEKRFDLITKAYPDIAIGVVEPTVRAGDRFPNAPDYSKKITVKNPNTGVEVEVWVVMPLGTRPIRYSDDKVVVRYEYHQVGKGVSTEAPHDVYTAVFKAAQALTEKDPTKLAEVSPEIAVAVNEVEAELKERLPLTRIKMAIEELEKYKTEYSRLEKDFEAAKNTGDEYDLIKYWAELAKVDSDVNFAATDFGRARNELTPAQEEENKPMLEEARSDFDDLTAKYLALLQATEASMPAEEVDLASKKEVIDERVKSTIDRLQASAPEGYELVEVEKAGMGRLLEVRGPEGKAVQVKLTIPPDFYYEKKGLLGRFSLNRENNVAVDIPGVGRFKNIDDAFNKALAILKGVGEKPEDSSEQLKKSALELGIVAPEVLGNLSNSISEGKEFYKTGIDDAVQKLIDESDGYLSLGQQTATGTNVNGVIVKSFGFNTSDGKQIEISAKSDSITPARVDAFISASKEAGVEVNRNEVVSYLAYKSLYENILSEFDKAENQIARKKRRSERNR